MNMCECWESHTRCLRSASIKISIAVINGTVTYGTLWMRNTSTRGTQSTHNHLLHFGRTIFIILRVLTITTHAYTLLRSVLGATKYLLCLKALWVISVIVSYLLHSAVSLSSSYLGLSFSLFISVLLFLWALRAYWDCRIASTGKIALDKRILMKGSGLGRLSFVWSAVGVSGGLLLWFWSPWYGDGRKVCLLRILWNVAKRFI